MRVQQKDVVVHLDLEFELLNERPIIALILRPSLGSQFSSAAERAYRLIGCCERESRDRVYDTLQTLSEEFVIL